MAKVTDFEKEKLIIGVLYNDREKLKEAMEILRERFGETDFETEEFSFSDEFSTYYDGELEGPAMRKIYSFQKTQDPSLLADIKIFTNELEFRLSKGHPGRLINLDPGFISHGKVMLATTKGSGFRFALKDGIYSELTLYYASARWQKLPWTYRDYQSERVQEFLTRVRKRYLEQRKSESST